MKLNSHPKAELLFIDLLDYPSSTRVCGMRIKLNSNLPVILSILKADTFNRKENGKETKVFYTTLNGLRSFYFFTLLLIFISQLKRKKSLRYGE